MGSVRSRIVTISKAHTRDISSVAIFPDGKRFVLAAATIRLSNGFDQRPGTPPLRRSYSRSELRSHRSCQWVVASGSADYTTRMWVELNEPALPVALGHDKRVRSVAFSHDGRHIVSGSDDKTIKLWDSNSRQVVHTFTGHTDQINTCYLYARRSVDRNRQFRQHHQNLEHSSGQLVRTLAGHTGPVHCLTISADGTHLFSGSEDHYVKCWESQHWA